jgi:AcrR family transcriptional regulator
VASKATADKRQRRERGSINPADIIDGAFELADEVSIEHLGVGVTSIYWYFRKKDDLLNAMADRALSQFTFATPYVEADDWRESLRNHARMMRKTFLSSPILTDLILIRGALSAKARRLGVEQMERAIESLVEAGLSPEDAFDTYSAVSLHVRGTVVLQRLDEKTSGLENDERAVYEPRAIDPKTTPLIAKLVAKGHRLAAADEPNFEYGLNCILDHAARLIAEGKKASKSAPRRGRKASAKR